MSGEAWLDADVADVVIASSLSLHPEAELIAFGEYGELASIPASVPLHRYIAYGEMGSPPAPVSVASSESLSAGSALDFIVPGDRVATMRMWERARSLGMARVNVHLLRAPTERVSLQCIDARARHGVYLAMVIPDDGEGLIVDPVASPVVAPRVAVIHKNEVSGITAIDDAVTRMLGWRADEIVGRHSLEFIHPDDHDRAIANWLEMVAVSGSEVRWRGRHKGRNGSWMWLEFTNHNHLEASAGGDVYCEMVDISEEMAAHEALRAREQFLYRLAESLPLGILQLDGEGRVIYTNDRLHTIVGVGPASTVDAQFAGLASEDRAVVDRAIAGVLSDGADADIEVRLMSAGGGEQRLCDVSLRALTNEHGDVNGAVVCVEDVTESARMRSELERRATFDVLTGCYNRAAIMSALTVTMGRQRGTSFGTGLIFIDLDRFKQVNDAHGHAAGDELLASVAIRLREAVRGNDLVGRIGGDEFLVVCPRIRNVDEVFTLAERLAEELHYSAFVGPALIEVKASLGLTWTNGESTAPDTLVAEADRAMYASKRQGAGRPVVFSIPLAAERALAAPTP